jgi:hypothetical protein
LYVCEGRRSGSSHGPSLRSLHGPTAAPASQRIASQQLAALKDLLAAKRTKAFLVIGNDKALHE